MSDSPTVARHLIIHGRVQGVFFRESMCRQAAALGVAGWVRNRNDGTVEAEVEGSPEAVAAMLMWAKRGPDAASVTRVEERAGTGNHIGFNRLPSL